MRGLFLLVLACQGPGGDDTAVVDTGDTGDDPPIPGLELGPEVICPSPYDEDFDRFTSVADIVGLTHVARREDIFLNPLVHSGEVVATDLDGDGDVDVSFGNPLGMPHVYENDGTGRFAWQGEPDSWATAYLEHVSNHAAVDLNGDRLPDWVLLSPGHVQVAWNQGDLVFAAPETLYRVGTDYPVPFWPTAAFGDADGDGDLDIALAGADLLQAAGDEGLQVDPPLPGTPELVLLRDGDEYAVSASLTPRGVPSLSLLTAWSDRDNDGDADLMATSDRAEGGAYPPNAFYRNDGPGADGPTFVNDAVDLGFELSMSGMGLAAVELNGDGLLDYVISDLAGMRVLMSHHTGIYIESDNAVGIGVPFGMPFTGAWFGWSVDVEDYDNDGINDAAVAAGSPVDPSFLPDGFQTPQANGLWQGREDGTYYDVATLYDFADTGDHYGMASADFDGDGFLDIVFAGIEGPPLLWANRCGSGAWLDLDFDGPAGNREGWGAVVVVQSGEMTQMRELHALRSMGQGPPRMHFGLGEADGVDRLEVRWPDGAVSIFEEPLPVRRRVRVLHPSRVESE